MPKRAPITGRISSGPARPPSLGVDAHEKPSTPGPEHVMELSYVEQALLAQSSGCF